MLYPIFCLFFFSLELRVITPMNAVNFRKKLKKHTSLWTALLDLNWQNEQQQSLSSGLKASFDSLAASKFLNFPALQNWVTDSSYFMGSVCSHSEVVPGNLHESANCCRLCAFKGPFLLLNWNEFQCLESVWISNGSECKLGLPTCAEITTLLLLSQTLKADMSITPISAITAFCPVWTHHSKKTIICSSMP